MVHHRLVEDKKGRQSLYKRTGSGKPQGWPGWVSGLVSLEEGGTEAHSVSSHPRTQMLLLLKRGLTC